MKNLLRSFRKPALAGGFLLAALVSAALADFYANRSVSATVPGVDEQGNASLALGSTGPGKSYKDINTGIIIQINRAPVANNWPVPPPPLDFARPKNFHNLGVPILDPQTGETLTSTADSLYIRAKLNLSTRKVTGWFGYLYAVYDPRFPVLEELEP